jgi:hypothetical protein
MKKPLQLQTLNWFNKLNYLCFLSLVSIRLDAQTLQETQKASQTLTDQEQREADNYVHQGLIDKKIKAECDRLGQQYKATGCDDTSAAPGYVMGGFLDEALPKLYAIMGTLALAGGGSKLTAKPEPKSAENATAGKNANKDDGVQDACIYIPMAGEVVASIMQKAAEAKIQNQYVNENDKQREGLYAVARVHEARSKSARMQSVIYASTSACYGFLASSFGGAALDWKMSLRIGASATMAVIFNKKASKHKDYAESLKSLARSLPGKGTCNPHTDTQCFCAEETSKTLDPNNYKKVCLVQGGATADLTKTQTACAVIKDGKAVVDKECLCKKRNNCFSGQIAQMIQEMGFDTIGTNDSIKLLKQVEGEMNDAQMTNMSVKVAAAAQNLLKNKPLTGSIPSVTAPKNAQSVMKELEANGLPRTLAAHVASQANADVPLSDISLPSQPPSLAALKANKLGYSGGVKVEYDESSSSSSRRQSNGGDDLNPFAAFGTKKPTSPQGGVVFEDDAYMAKAIQEAEITQDAGQGLFEIISNRYQKSAQELGEVR